MAYAVVFQIVMFLVYNYLVFALMDTLLAKPRLKKHGRIIVGIINTLLALFGIFVLDISSLGAYIVLSIVMFVEFMLFYGDKRTSSLFCTLSCVIHVIGMRSIIVATFAIFNNTSLQAIENDLLLNALTTGIVFALLNIVIYIVVKVIPATNIRIITQHSEQVIYMTSWMAIFVVYLISNSTVYNTQCNDMVLIVNQITAPIAIIVGVYVFLFFTFKSNALLGYKEQTEKLQITVDKERKYRLSIDKGVFRVIEVNFNKDKILSGFEDYEEFLGDSIYDYSRMLAFMIQSTVHPEDKEEFIKCLSPLAVVDEYNNGKTEIIFDYRRLMPDGSYVWMHVLMALMQGAAGEDVVGFVQIRDIDAEKKQQIALQYKAERDLLTGLYNKSTTETLISKKLTDHKDTSTSGILFVIDIDNFKTINDRLGHLYGDAVLSELSESLRKIFRDCDIVGRIGGDEFLVFVEGSHSEQLMVKKAKSICSAFLQTYANEKNEGYTVSSSVGVAVYPKDGNNFEDLFKCADLALYTAKAQGKNCYSFYNENSHMSYLPTRTEIDTNGLVQKNFKSNRIEYVFRLLNSSVDTTSAIESVLELIAKNFGFSRANIFELNEESTLFNGVFEWCAKGIASVSSNYVEMPISNFDFVIKALDKSGGMFLAVPTDFPVFAQESYTSIGIKSIVHFSIKERGTLIGVIAFQNCANDNFSLSDVDFEELRTICQVLSVFMSKQLSNDREQRHHHSVEALMDNMNCISYVIDKDTYEVYYENQNAISITGHKSVGTKCHHSYRGLDKPCDDCPLSLLTIENPRCTLELFTKKFNLYTKTTAALLDWSNNKKAMLISSVDITEYKIKQDDKN